MFGNMGNMAKGSWKRYCIRISPQQQEEARFVGGYATLDKMMKEKEQYVDD